MLASSRSKILPWAFGAFVCQTNIVHSLPEQSSLIASAIVKISSGYWLKVSYNDGQKKHVLNTTSPDHRRSCHVSPRGHICPGVCCPLPHTGQLLFWMSAAPSPHWPAPILVHSQQAHDTLFKTHPQAKHSPSQFSQGFPIRPGTKSAVSPCPHYLPILHPG